MDIGKPKRVYTVEPLEAPVPQTQPAEVVEPSPAEPAPREPARVPAGV
jgi:hypothetical protein